MSLNLFPATDLRPEVELMHLLRMLLCADNTVMFETGGIGQTLLLLLLLLLQA